MPEHSAHDGNAKIDETSHRLDAAVLKGVYEKCTKRYDGKYPSGLFDINVRLDDTELAHIAIIITEAKRLLGHFATSHPAYPKFDALLREMRKKVGTFGESGRIIGDSSATAATDELMNGNVPAIRAPSAVADFYAWKLYVESLEDTLRLYRAGIMRGCSATEFGKNVKEVFRLVKEAKHQQ